MAHRSLATARDTENSSGPHTPAAVHNCRHGPESPPILNLDNIGTLAALTTQIEALLDAGVLPDGSAPPVILRGITYSTREDWFGLTNKLVAAREVVLHAMGSDGERLIRRIVRAVQRRRE